MAKTDWFRDAANTAIGVGKAALSRFGAPESADAAKVSEMAAKRKAPPSNPLTKTSAFRTMGQKPSAFKTVAKGVGTSMVDGLNLANSGVSLAQGDYQASPGQVIGDIGSLARIARLNQTVANKGGAPVKLAADPRTTMIAYGADMVAPHVKEAFDPTANAARFEQNKATALNPPPATYWEKLLGLESPQPSQGYKDSVAAGASVSPSNFQGIPGTTAFDQRSTGRKPMQDAKQLGGPTNSSPVINKQLGEIFDFALQRGIDPAYEYMGHVMRRDGLSEEQGFQLYNAFMNKLYKQQAFDKAVNQPLITDPGQLAKYREVR
jgi:hypothetical protein